MMKIYQIIENNITYNIEEYHCGTKIWYKDKIIHRENGIISLEMFIKQVKLKSIA